MDTFKIGEVAILVALNPFFCPYDGEEVVIESVLKESRHPFGYKKDETGHDVRLSDGHITWSAIRGLRKRPPPTQGRQELGEWDRCPWQPAKRVVVCEEST
jgi:hypothetical protein